MVTNNEITTNKSDIINSKEIDKELQREIMPVSRNIDLGFETGIPPFNKILVTCDGTDKSDKAINYSLYLSNISKAEIVILQVIGNIDKLGNSSIDVSNKKEKNTKSETSTSSNMTNDSSIDNSNYAVNIEGNIIKSMEDKINEIENSGFKNKLSYKIRPGFVPDEIVKEIKESKYDLLIISSSHMDSWINSLFSETRKIISKVDLPVLLLR
ncbi:MAG: universal stress protein [Candidatus Nitrosocosmicus sp.]|nr:universal stress protein [Candidatus Nitrosocosmicus sp.]MDN5867756.1 universal stress protein [Candidatus Nitrosocosmicus sp.]